MHTHDLRRYARRLLVLAVISEIPFDMVAGGTFFYIWHQNVAWTLLAGLGTCYCADHLTEKDVTASKRALYALGLAAAVALPYLLMTDYDRDGVLLILLFWFTRKGGAVNGLIQVAAMIVMWQFLFTGRAIMIGTFEFQTQCFALCALPLEETPALTAARQLHSVFPFGDNAGAALGIAQQDEVSGKLTLTFSVLHLDESGFSGQFDVRAPLCATKENCSGAVERRFAAFGWSCEGEMSEVHMVDADSDFIRTLLSSYEHFSGKEGYCVAIGGGTYAKALPNIVAFGPIFPGEEVREHKPDEYISVDSLMRNAQIIAAAMYEMAK